VITGKYQLNNPGKMQATMQITMAVEEWEQIKEELGDSYPNFQFKSLISDLINSATKEFYRRIDNDDDDDKGEG
jgi:hypothetical protein